MKGFFLSRHCDVLIVTALADELAPIRKAFAASRVRPDEIGSVYSYYETTVYATGTSALKVVLGTARAKGSAKMSAFVTRSLATWRPRHVILAGIAAGVPEAGVGIGVVMVSSAVIDVTELKIRPSGRKTTGRRFSYPCDEDLLHPLGAFLETISDATPRIGLMLCQPNVVKAAEVRRWLVSGINDFFDQPPVGIEMEGVGLAVAVQSEPRDQRPSFVVVKGAVDLANFHKADAARESTTTKVAEFLNNFLEGGWLPGASKPSNLHSEKPTASEVHNLVGRSEEVGDLLAELQHPDGSLVVSIEGLGGIGKTALAGHVTEVLMEVGAFEKLARFTVQNGEEQPEDVLSIEALINAIAAQLGFSNLSEMAASRAVLALPETLEKTRALIVIDNIERPADLEAVCALFSRLRRPCQTRIVLTSRPDISRYWPDARSLIVPQLDLESSIELLHLGLQRRTFGATEVPREDLLGVFGFVGGNPQALLVAAGLFSRYPGEVILGMLRRGKDAADSFYKHVYLTAWVALGQAARNLLISMRDLPEDGADWQRLAAVSGLNDEGLVPILGELLDQHLVTTTSDSGVSLYGMHRLTSTFVEGVVDGWDAELKDRVIRETRRRNVLHTLQQVEQVNDI